MINKDFLNKEEISTLDLENFLNLVSESDEHNPILCCDNKKIKFLGGGSWTTVTHCESCDRITVTYIGDKMGGQADYYAVFAEPTQDQPLIEFNAINDLMRFYDMADPYAHKRWSMHNLYSIVSNYKLYKRYIQKNNKPDISDMFKDTNGNGQVRQFFDKHNVWEQYDECYNFLINLPLKS